SFDFYLRDCHSPPFNLADSAIVLGALLVVSSSLRRKKANTNAEPDGADRHPRLPNTTTGLHYHILHLRQYQVPGCRSTDDELQYLVDVPDPIACEECGVQGEFVRFGKRDVPYRDLPIHGKRVTLWVVRRRYTCRACKTTFRPQLPEMVDGFR